LTGYSLLIHITREEIGSIKTGERHREGSSRHDLKPDLGKELAEWVPRGEERGFHYLKDSVLRIER
jgi:hypothetical protein